MVPWKDGFENKICKIIDNRLMENSKNLYVVKAKILNKGSGFYDQLEDVDFFLDGCKGWTCGTYRETSFSGPACCECVIPDGSFTVDQHVGC